jgi:hypothetical protein
MWFNQSAYEAFFVARRGWVFLVFIDAQLRMVHHVVFLLQLCV